MFGGFGRALGLRKPLRKSRNGRSKLAPVRVSIRGTSRWPHVIEKLWGVHFSLKRLPIPVTTTGAP